MMRLGPGRLPKDRKSGHLCKPLLPSDLRLIQVPFVQAGQTIGSPGGESQSAGVPFDPFGSAPDRTHLLSPADPHASLDGLRVEYGIEKSSNKLLALTELDSDTWVSNTPPLLPGCHRQGPKPSPHKRQTSGQKPTDKRARTPGGGNKPFLLLLRAFPPSLFYPRRPHFALCSRRLALHIAGDGNLNPYCNSTCRACAN